MDKQAVSEKWLEKAKDDLRWTEANIKQKIWYGACFMAHQAVEKVLKAYLLRHGKTIRKIHDLSALLEACIQLDLEFESLREGVLPIVDYYIQTRYPDAGDFIDYTEESATSAFESSKRIVEFVEGKL